MNASPRQPYRTDLSDAQWELIKPLIVLPTGGAPRTTDIREIINAILYQSRTGCQWYLLPHALPPANIVLPKAPCEIIFTVSNGQDYGNTSMTICVVLSVFKPDASRSRVWESSIARPRKALGTAVKAGTMRRKETKKKIKGIKRHFLVDVMGLLLFIVVHAANIQERAGAKLVLEKASNRGMPRLEKILSDDGYSGKPLADEVREKYSWEFESVKRTELHKFVVLPQRWVVERTIGWMNNWRALSKHYDYDSRTGEAKILLASVYYMSKRLTHREPEPKIDPVIEAKLRKLVEKTAENVDQTT